MWRMTAAATLLAVALLVGAPLPVAAATGPMTDARHDRVDEAERVTTAGGAPTLSGLVDSVHRVGTRDRFSTAAALSQISYPGEVDTAYVVASTAVPDALAAGAAAAVVDAPVLLATRWRLRQPTADALARLDVDTVVVVGGPRAISDDVLDAVGDAAGVEPQRVAGDDRSGTAAALALHAFTDPGVALVANGRDVAHALAAGAAAAADDAPLLLIGQDRVPTATRRALAVLEPDELVILGGQDSVSRTAERTLAETSAATTRLAGADQFDTAARVAERAAPEGADTAYLAVSADLHDVLVAGPAAAAESAPLLLTPGDELLPVVRQTLEGLGVERVVSLGGDAVRQDAAADVDRVGRPNHLNVPIHLRATAAILVGLVGGGHALHGLARRRGRRPVATRPPA